MNIIRIRQQERVERISSIAATINAKLNAFMTPEFSDVVNKICLQYNCSMRIAKEYLNLAVFQANAKVVDGKIYDQTYNPVDKQTRADEILEKEDLAKDEVLEDLHG